MWNIVKGAPYVMAGLAVVLAGASTDAVAQKEIPSFTAKDIRGQTVSLDALLEHNPRLVVLCFITTDTGEGIARRLRRLDLTDDKNQLEIIAFGYKEDEAALKHFADRLQIEYYVINKPPDALEAADALGPIKVLPTTILVAPKKRHLKTVVGSGDVQADIIVEVAKTYMMQNATQEAAEIAKLAVEEGENPATAKSVLGHALAKEGKLDEAEAAFKEAGSASGLATVALERGEYDKAAQIASQADPAADPYAATVTAKAYLRAGKMDEAEKAFGEAAKLPAEEWQRSEALTGLGRVEQQSGDVEAAIKQYNEALDLNPFNIVALSNQGAAYRDQGQLEKAQEVLAKAQDPSLHQPDDPLVGMMLRQIVEELQKANDLKRKERIDKLIKDLSARAKELKEKGLDKPADEWTSRPLVVAFLPAENRSPVFFERAGTELALRREIEARLQQHERIQVVEREMLDQLLQELNLGTSEVANPDTQLVLGRVLAAQLLGFIEFGQTGGDKVMYLRMVNSETTAIDTQMTKIIKDTGNLDELVTGIVDGLAKEIAGERRLLQGLIADATDENAVIINLGKGHGLQPGAQFVVLRQGPPVEVGGRQLGGRMEKAGMLEVVEVDDEIAVCKTIEKGEGVKLAKEMKIREIMKK